MKHLIIFILTLFLFIACNHNQKVVEKTSEKTTFNKTISSDSIDNNSSVPVKKDTLQKKVYISLKSDSISLKDIEKPAILNILNNSDITIAFGQEIKIEKFDGKNWNHINSQAVFPEMAYALVPGRNYNINFTPKFDGNISQPGFYRLTKSFFDSQNIHNRKTETINFKVYAPFIDGLEHRVFLKVPETIKMSQLKEKIKIQIINNAPKTISFGDDYKVQKFDGKEFKDIRLSFFINSIGYELFTGTERNDLYFRLHPEQYQYKPGTYRILKSYSFINDFGNFEKVNFWVSEEFKIIP